MNEIKVLIPQCYHENDTTFGGQGGCLFKAKELIIKALNNKIGFDNYINLHKEYLANQNLTKEKIEEELNKVKNIESYFTCD